MGVSADQLIFSGSSLSLVLKLEVTTPFSSLRAQPSHLYFTFILLWVPFCLALLTSLLYSLHSLPNCVLSLVNHFDPFLLPEALTWYLARFVVVEERMYK